MSVAWTNPEPTPSGYNALNYTEQGGDVTHIGGKLIIDEGGSVEGLPSSPGSGSVMENQSASEATTVAALKEEFNSLLAKLKAAGLMAADTDQTEE